MRDTSDPVDSKKGNERRSDDAAGNLLRNSISGHAVSTYDVYILLVPKSNSRNRESSRRTNHNNVWF